jgi:cation:H+ antiporter
MLTGALLIGGLLALVAGAEGLIRGASSMARRWGVPPLVVGLTVVAYGTSAPEMVVSAQAARAGQAGLALGNVIGSNIFNVLFILGLSALIAPLVVHRALIQREAPIMVGASLLMWGLGLNGQISRGEGAVLILLLLAYTAYQVKTGLQEAPPRTDTARPASLPGAALLTAGGLALLVLGARWFLAGSVSVARGLGFSELIIGLTLIAAGTSLPEVATSVLASLKGERDIAVGNVVGSNIFNILGVLGLAAVIAPDGVEVARAAEGFDIPVMTAVAVACLPVFFTGHRIARWEGGVFLAYYAAYLAFLILDAREHDALPLFNAWMTGFAVPLTVLTLGVAVARHRKTLKPPSL